MGLLKRRRSATILLVIAAELVVCSYFFLDELAYHGTPPIQNVPPADSSLVAKSKTRRNPTSDLRLSCRVTPYCCQWLQIFPCCSSRSLFTPVSFFRIICFLLYQVYSSPHGEGRHRCVQRQSLRAVFTPSPARPCGHHHSLCAPSCAAFKPSLTLTIILYCFFLSAC